MSSTLPVDTTRIRNRATLIELVGGYMASQALALAAELRLADHIAAGRTTGPALAEVTGTHAPSLYRVLRLLAAAGITTEPRPGEFGLTEVGEQLRSDSPDSLWAFTRFFTDPALFSSWQRVRHAVETGRCAFDELHGRSIYAHLAGRPELSGLFNEAMGQESRISAELVAHGHDFTGVRRMVDVGGGDGTVLAAILGVAGHLTGVCFDSPSGVAGAAAVLERAGVAGRGEVVAGDFFSAVPGDGDLYLIKSVFQDWDDEQAAALLRTVRAHMPGHARLLVVGSVLPDTADRQNPVAFLTDVNMLVTAGGRERTESEFRALLTAAGFHDVSVRHGAAGPLSTIEAVPA